MFKATQEGDLVLKRVFRCGWIFERAELNSKGDHGFVRRDRNTAAQKTAQVITNYPVEIWPNSANHLDHSFCRISLTRNGIVCHLSLRNLADLVVVFGGNPCMNIVDTNCGHPRRLGAPGSGKVSSIVTVNGVSLPS